MWPKLMSSSSFKSTFNKLSTAGEGELPMARRLNKARNSFNVDEEYTKALRTKSYVDMYAKVHRQLNRTTSPSPSTTTTNSSPLSFRYYNRLPDFLLEPSQESLLAATSSSSPSSSSSIHLHLNTLLLDFFDTTLQACTACASLLVSIDRARSHHRSIHRLLLNLSSNPSPSTFSELSSHLELDNPLSPQNLSHFHVIHSRYPPLIRRLTSLHRKITRRLKLIRLTKKASGLIVIVLLGAVVVAAVVIATHAVVAVAAAPVVAVSGWKGVGRCMRGWVRLEGAKARVDAAAKGAYIVGRDLDTMSRMVRRVHDEVEHGRDVARMVVRNKEWQMVREVVREMEGRGEEVGLGLEEQLKELEEHVYLCLITINRSRRLVAQEMMEPSEERMGV